MAIRELRYLGDAVLRQKTDPVELFDDELGTLLDDLAETMYANMGVGLAAPQVGDSRRVTVVDVSEARDETEVLELINPVLVSRSGLIDSEEGCLSIPGVVESIERSAEVEIEYQDRNGDRHTVQGVDLLSRILQHELDHLEGILFIDHLGTLRRDMAVREFKIAMAENDLPVGPG
ncbi:MAG: peptide deformylase [Gemmatimonadetes bacterium]|nr:peptide deformylase [Gemmatimonadota bacterium]